MAENLHFTCYKYGAHDLQRVGVWAVDPALHEVAEQVKSGGEATAAPADENAAPAEGEDAETKTAGASAPGGNGYWIIYIHGGAWRDPQVTYEGFVPAINHICKGDSKLPIAAFASIDYRLSPHPSHPQDPATTAETALRNARHPDHLHDVCAAIVFLNRKFGFGSRYILVGHSAGATLAFQAIMRVLDSQSRAMHDQTKRSYEQEESESEVMMEQGHKKRRKDTTAAETEVAARASLDGVDANSEDYEEARNSEIEVVEDDGDGEWEDDPDWEDVEEARDQSKADLKGGLKANFWQDLLRKQFPSWNNGQQAGPHGMIREISPVKLFPGEEKEDHFTLPQAIVGMSGVYEFQRFNERHNREYTGFLSAAFGDDETKWNEAAPVAYPGNFGSWNERKICVFGWSSQDTRVDELEMIGMTKKLEESYCSYFAEKSLSGDHDFAWKDGAPLARMVEEALERIAKSLGL